MNESGLSLKSFCCTPTPVYDTPTPSEGMELQVMPEIEEDLTTTIRESEEDVTNLFATILREFMSLFEIKFVELLNTESIKEGFLMKHSSPFNRWRRRYFRVKERKLFYAKDDKAHIFDEIDLVDLAFAEGVNKTYKHCFHVITRERVLILAADSRTAMEEWIHAIRTGSNVSLYETEDHSQLLSGAHIWYATGHARPTYCNICREQLGGVTSNGLSCEICKFKTHKKCASRAQNNCKWTTLASIGKDIIEEADGTLSLPHQWLEGNLPVSARCEICDKNCGSVLRLQDFRCLWCRVAVHTTCKPQIWLKCRVGKISIVPPTALHTIGSDDAWEASKPLQGCSPLLVFVNSKSGDHQGVKFLRRFKQLLNPAQVFDLMVGGPRLGLQLFRHFEPFRILVCGGDGSVGWVMSEIDKLEMRRQCQVGVLPLGTGNDLARVLGWGSSCDDDANLPHLLEKYEKATTKMLDRWSIMTFERGVVLKPAACSVDMDDLNEEEKPQIAHYEDSVVSHLQNILQSDQHQTVISSAKVLCETVRDMIGRLGTSGADSEINEKCATLSQKLDSLLQTLQEETEQMGDSTETEPPSLRDEEEAEEAVAPIKVEETPAVLEETEEQSQLTQTVAGAAGTSTSSRRRMNKFRQREALMSRANSLKKAVRQIIEHAEKTLDEQNSAPRNNVVVVRPMSRSQMLMQMQIAQQVSVTKDNTMTITSPDGEQAYGVQGAQGGYQDEDLRRNNLNIVAPSATNVMLSPMDPNMTLPVPNLYGDQARKLSNASTNASTISAGEELEDEEADLDRNDIPLIDGSDNSDDLPEREKTEAVAGSSNFNAKPEDKRRGSEEKVGFPQIEVESPSSSMKTRDSDEADNDVSIGQDSSAASNLSAAAAGTTGAAGGHLAVPGSAFPRGASPRGSRRISMGSLLKPLEVDIPGPSSPRDVSDGISYSSAANSPFSSSAHSSPNKSSSHHQKRKTLPIVNPLVSHPSWPAVTSGGVISQVLLANADTICAVASPLMDPEIDPDDLMIGFQEKCVMNNYFGIGIDAKITLDFHLKREEHPEKLRSRTRNFLWYGLLGGKEFLQKSCKNLEQRVQLECDGKRLPLPSLQGIVILNIQSFMGGTNFWGGTKEDDYFLAPSFDDKILEVVAVFDTMQMAASRLMNLQHHRICQCHQVKITLLGDEPIPVQVDGEAWLQPPGVIRIVHKNRMQMLCRNRALETSLKAWEEKQKHSSSSPCPGDQDELDRKRHSKGIFKLKFRKEKRGDEGEAAGEMFSDGFSEEYGSPDAKPVDKWSSSDVGEWLEHLQFGEYKVSFLRHDIRGSELLSLQRRDLRELGVTKVGHVKRILKGIENLKAQFEPSTSSVPAPAVPSTSAGATAAAEDDSSAA